MHAFVTVMVPDYLEEEDVKLFLMRALSPYDEALEVEPYETDCEYCEYADEICEDCEGAGVRMTSFNPQAKWDYWTEETLGHTPSAWQEATYAIVVPEGGWLDRGDVGSDMEQWALTFRKMFLASVREGYVPRVLDYHQ